MLLLLLKLMADCISHVPQVQSLFKEIDMVGLCGGGKALTL